MARLTKGLVQVYTGPGKGKTTAALGLSLRAAGHGLHTCIIQFMKRGWDSGERAALARLSPEVELHVFGSERWGDPSKAPPGTPWWELPPSNEDRSQAEEAMTFARGRMASGECDIVILDEVLGALGYNLVSLSDLLDLIRDKPPAAELVLTGRNAPPEIIAAADLVTEMQEVGHPFRKGMKARRGIEY
ncbi:MAG: cob(I)yrinic acid a,c-diamide adenosyltransferase [Armatimonadota bacterium]